MKHRLLRVFILVLATACAVSSQPPPTAGGGLTPLPLYDDSKEKEKKKTKRETERGIENRDRNRHGIIVGEPKVYDDALLQKMLEETENRLAQLKLINEGKILERLGSVTGAEQSISSVGLNIQGPSLPGVDTVTKPTGTEETVKVAPASPPAAPTVPTAQAMPSSFNVSASDMLNEQMQLNFEAAMLRLLVGGSLSDYFVKMNPTDNSPYVKLKTTLGFPITIIPDKRHRDAVAIVEVEVERLSRIGREEPPAITALLPREKTYNVASLTDKSTSIQGGVVTQVIGVGGSWLRGRKTYYLVQDQDTVALSYQPEKSKRVGFMWQFRPVLGRDVVKAGQKNTFVQIAFPAPPGAGEGQIGKIHVRTYWRKYDRKKGIVKEIIPYSLNDDIEPFDIPRYELTQPALFNASSLEDIGEGQILVRVQGRFLPGTYVRIGAARPALAIDYYNIRFIASVDDLATKKVALVSHDGTEADLKIDHLIGDPSKPTEPPGPRPKPEIIDVKVTTIDGAKSLVTVKLRDRAHILEDKPPPVIVIGGKIFGYSDAPIQRNVDDQTLSVVVPTALLIGSPEVVVKPLLAPTRYEARWKLRSFDFTSSGEELTILEQDGKVFKFLLRGSRLSDISVVVPSGVIPDDIGRPEDKGTMRTITLTDKHLAAHKHLVLQRRNERPFMIAIPSLEKKTPKPIQPTERVVVNADEVVLEGDGVGEIASATYKGRKINVVKGKDGSVSLAGMRLQGVTEVAMTRTIDLKFKDGKTGTVKLDIVTSKVEHVNK